MLFGKENNGTDWFWLVICIERGFGLKIGNRVVGNKVVGNGGGFVVGNGGGFVVGNGGGFVVGNGGGFVVGNGGGFVEGAKGNGGFGGGREDKRVNGFIANC